MDMRNFSFGGTAAVVTSLGLIIGLDAASVARATIVGSLLIVAIADNLTDSLGIHMYQESERLEASKAFRATLSNFATRLALSLSFVVLIIALPVRIAMIASGLWANGTYLSPLSMDNSVEVLALVGASKLAPTKQVGFVTKTA
ncbi:MAG: hypothetical protein NUV34_11810 [Sulfuricaulis sp.]|nr:hypothetical protein [Sulfuricaulis sp.]